jgi:hypothetical protein
MTVDFGSAANRQLDVGLLAVNFCLLAANFQVGNDAILTGHGRAVMVLDLLLVLSQLLFHFGQDTIDRRHQFGRGLGRHKIVFVFGGNQEFDTGRIFAFEIDSHFDCREPLEYAMKLIDFCGNFAPRGVAQLPMTDRNFGLH